jgi:hypothetical protein
LLKNIRPIGIGPSDGGGERGAVEEKDACTFHISRRRH